MHTIWGRLGFRQSDLRVVFAGRSDVRNTVMYDSARNQFNVDIYAGWQAVADRLLPVFERFRPPYLHGYPSSIFDFVQWLEENNHPLLDAMRGKIRGIFLGSEFPAPQPRKATERLLGCSSISWYGHTERALLACETDQAGVYEPFQTYGFAESVRSDEHSRLLCTGYYNQASPFIRYDTGDLIDGQDSEGLLQSFTIREGRSGEFIVDAHGNKVFLTALVFGRHHKCFDYCSHIQLKQEYPGQVTVFGVVRQNNSADSFAQDFDVSNVALKFDFRLIPEPFRTNSGKVPLLVR
jgi:phenylacetate-CoA ligase